MDCFKNDSHLVISLNLLTRDESDKYSSSHLNFIKLEV
jgi:hypothetical protein